MPQKVKIKASLKRAGLIKRMWEARRDLTMGSIGFADYVAMYQSAEGLTREYDGKTIEMRALRQRRDRAVAELNGLVQRFRYSMLGHYGRNSPLLNTNKL